MPSKISELTAWVAALAADEFPVSISGTTYKITLSNYFAGLTSPTIKLPVFADTTTPTKTVGFSLSGATASTQTTLVFSQTTARTITFPDYTDTLAVLGGSTQTFTATQYFNAGLYAMSGTALYSNSGTNYIGIRTTGGVQKLFTTTAIDITISPNDSPSAVFKSGGGLVLGSSSLTSSACLEVVSTTKGFLPPKVTTTQRDSIASPVDGLVVYNTTTQQLNVHNGTVWKTSNEPLLLISSIWS